MTKDKITEAQKAEISGCIYTECLEIVQWTITKMYGHLGRSVIHDALQETWKRMIEHFDEVYGMSHKAQAAWLITVASRYILDICRAYEKTILVDDMEPYMESIGEDADPVSREAINRVTAREILDKFTKEEKKTLFAKRNATEVFPFADEKENKNAETCKRYRIRKKLVKYMREGGIDAGK